MNAQISVLGIRELDDLIREMPAQFQHKFLQKVHADAAASLVYREHRLAPVRSGRTADSVGIIKPAFTKASLVGEVQVGPRRGRYGGNVAHLIEGGTKPRTAYSMNAADRGVMPKKPFVQPAWDMEHAAVERSITNQLSIRLERYLKKMIKNG